MRGLKIAANIVGWFLFALMGIIVLANVVMAIKSNQGEKLPSFLGFSNAKIISGSMEPTIKVNDLVIIHRESDYKEGQIITYLSGGAVVTHRIVGVSTNSAGEKCFRTKGDYNNTPDQVETDIEAYIPISNVYGKVIITVGNGGALLNFFKSPLGIIIVLGIALIILLLPTIIDFIKKQAQKKNIEAEKKRLNEQIERLEQSKQKEEQ